MSADDVTITKAEYLRLLEASLELEQLQDAGVDNWPGRDHVDWGQIEDAMAGARAVLEPKECSRRKDGTLMCYPARECSDCPGKVER